MTPRETQRFTTRFATDAMRQVQQMDQELLATLNSAQLAEQRHVRDRLWLHFDKLRGEAKRRTYPVYPGEDYNELFGVLEVLACLMRNADQL